MASSYLICDLPGHEDPFHKLYGGARDHLSCTCASEFILPKSTTVMECMDDLGE